MCGRFAQTSSAQDYAELVGATSGLDSKPQFNVTPDSSVVAALQQEGELVLAQLRWNLVPQWSKGPDSRFRMHNARAETLAEKPAFRSPFRKQRCLIPADGFYEWQNSAVGKQPYYIYKEGGEPMVFAGLWDSWQDSDDNLLRSCTIVTTAANDLMQPIHHRMPVILPKENWSQWLEDDNTLRLQALLLPYRKTNLCTHPVSKRVNNPANNDAELLNPV